MEWLEGRKVIGEASIACYAFALSDFLRKIERPNRLDVNDVIDRHAYSLWNKLLTYQDYEPLRVLVETACSGRVSMATARTVMADLVDRSVQDAGTMPMLSFRGGYIYWKSVTDSGKGHKRKELTGRAHALRYSYSDGVFQLRERAHKLFLVVDGTFDDQDLKVLQESGWDRIFYPDEMPSLVAALGE